MERNIWFYWNQGWEAAPWFVKLNYISWVTRNPDWKIVFLDDNNVRKYSRAFEIVERNKESITVTAFSDVLRLDLLANCGGAWVDATLLCTTPLEAWLPGKVSASGFFSFRSGCVDRDLASWHVAAQADNYLVRKWLELTEWYWGQHQFHRPEPQWPILSKLYETYCVSREATENFFSDDTLNVKRVYPYFWVNYLHQHLVRSDSRAAAIWDETPHLNCGPQSYFLSRDPKAVPNDEARKLISMADLLMFKFDRRTMPELPPEGSALEVLYRPLMGLPLPVISELIG